MDENWDVAVSTSLCPTWLLPLHLLFLPSFYHFVLFLLLCFALHLSSPCIKDFQKFSWNFRYLGLHLQNTSCSKLRDKFGNRTYHITTLWQNQDCCGGILGGYLAILHHRQSVHTRQCLGGAKETSLSKKGIFWVTSVNYSDIQCYSNTYIICWHLHCNIKTIPRHHKYNCSANGDQKR